MTVIDVGSRYSAAGRVTFHKPIRVPTGRTVSCWYAGSWTMVSQADLGIEAWVGMGDRPRQALFWVALDMEGRILLLVPAENVAGFVAGVESSATP